MTEFSPVPLLLLAGFLLANIYVIRSQLGVKSYDEFATANRAVGFVGVALAIYTTWYVGAVFTAWAGFSVGLGFIAFYTLVYGTFGLVTMMLIARKTYLWGKKYDCQTQADLMGLRYQSKTLKVLMGVCGLLFSIPWLFMEFVTLAFAFEYGSYGRVPGWIGVLLGVTLIGAYVGMGGMKAAMTAAIFQGGFHFLAGAGVFLFLILHFFGDFGNLFSEIQAKQPELMTYPGPGVDFPVQYWTSIVVTSSLGNFMWPWIMNKLLTADSIKSIKYAALGAPVLGAITWILFVFLGMGAHLLPGVGDRPQEAYFLLSEQAGSVVLGLFICVVVITNIGTCAGIIQAIATHVTVDIAKVINRNISDRGALTISRTVVVISCATAFLMSLVLSIQSLIDWALFTYQGMVLFWPIVVLGMWWKRANATGALVGFIGGLAISWTLSLWSGRISAEPPAFLADLGWSQGMYASAFTFLAMFFFGMLKKPKPYVDLLFDDTNPEPLPAGGSTRLGTAPAPSPA